MSAIDEIKDNKLAIAENQKEYYTRLTDTLRIYIKERFGFSAMEMTTREIINRLQAEDPMKVAELREVFETADLVKFAKYSTLINENDRNLVSAIDFINSTKTEEIVEEHKEEEQLTEEQKQTNVTIKALKVLTYIAAFASAIILCITIWQVVMLIE
jgi:CHASE3 domain sensor protein